MLWYVLSVKNKKYTRKKDMNSVSNYRVVIIIPS
jgi:hypothetical protein